MAPSCPQQDVTLPIPNDLAQEAVDAILNTIYGVIFPDSEDCECLSMMFHDEAGMDLDGDVTDDAENRLVHQCGQAV